MDFDLVIGPGTIVTVDPRGRILERGAVGIVADRIAFVGPAHELASANVNERLDAHGGIVMPGLVNAHTHAPMAAMRGLADDRTLHDWLYNFIFPAEAASVDARFVRESTPLAIAEMIEGGTTTFADMYYFEQEVALACKRAGIRCVAGETVLDFPAPDHKTVDAAFAYTREFIQEWRGDPLIVPAIAPHAPYTAGPETLRRACALAREFGVPALIHLAETAVENDDILARYGRRPVRHMEALGLLWSGLVAAHAVWLDDEEIRLLVEAGVGIVHCPQSNMKLASGIARVPDLVAAGARLGLGTDGPVSNNDLDLLEEAHTAALLAKVTRSPTALPARQAIEMATIGGARALRLDDRIGSLEVGKEADVCVIDTRALRLRPIFDALSHLVYAARGHHVMHTVCRGQVLLRDRQLQTIDGEAAALAAEALAAHVREKLGIRSLGRDDR